MRHENPFLKEKLKKRAINKQKWLERQIRPKVKDTAWALKFQTDVGVRLALKQEWLDDSTLNELIFKIWSDV